MNSLPILILADWDIKINVTELNGPITDYLSPAQH